MLPLTQEPFTQNLDDNTLNALLASPSVGAGSSDEESPYEKVSPLHTTHVVASPHDAGAAAADSVSPGWRAAEVAAKNQAPDATYTRKRTTPTTSPQAGKKPKTSALASPTTKNKGKNKVVTIFDDDEDDEGDEDDLLVRLVGEEGTQMVGASAKGLPSPSPRRAQPSTTATQQPTNAGPLAFDDDDDDDDDDEERAPLPSPMNLAQTQIAPAEWQQPPDEFALPPPPPTPKAAAGRELNSPSTTADKKGKGVPSTDDNAPPRWTARRVGRVMHGVFTWLRQVDDATNTDGDEEAFTASELIRFRGIAIPPSYGTK